MVDDHLKLQVRLIFWQLFDTGLQYNKVLHASTGNSIKELLLKEGYEFPYTAKDTENPEYIYEDENGYREKVAWLASTASQYMPLIIHLTKDQFQGPDNVQGSITIQAHLHYGGCLLFDCKIDYTQQYTVNELVHASIPKDLQLQNAGQTLWDYMLQTKDKLITVLKRGRDVCTQVRPDHMVQTMPWHHTWIIEGTNQTTPSALASDTWQQEFLTGGKYYREALGLTQRSDMWSSMSLAFFGNQLTNHSPYENSVVYITNAGNVIVPNNAFKKIDSLKNKLVDVIFATEMGNVQRFLSLVHVTYIADEAIRLQKTLESFHKLKLKESELVDKLRDLEEELTRVSLEINDDLMIFRVRRLMFTSILKLTLFMEMIKSLHGDEYLRTLDDFLNQMQNSLARETEVLTMRVSQQESSLLYNLQLVNIITLATGIIALFFYDPTAITFSLGAGLLITAVFLTLLTYLVLRFFLPAQRSKSTPE